jgi:predicted Zn-ribbon and HTH transcriptional regulator
MKNIKANINGVNYVYCNECGYFLKDIIVHKSKCVSCSGDFSILKK